MKMFDFLIYCFRQTIFYFWESIQFVHSKHLTLISFPFYFLFKFHSLLVLIVQQLSKIFREKESAFVVIDLQFLRFALTS